jgi:GNAT superfamily N-acetyltransferase
MPFRLATVADEPFLWTMLYEAAYWNEAEPRPAWETFLADDHNRRYLDDWGRPGDAGVVAITEGGMSAGAAWYRLFAAERPGWGFVAEDVPELSIAVLPALRGKGIGTTLLRALIDEGKRAGFSALTLSASQANPAVRMYERAGFVVVGREGNSVTMVRSLP